VPGCVGTRRGRSEGVVGSVFRLEVYQVYQVGLGKTGNTGRSGGAQGIS